MFYIILDGFMTCDLQGLQCLSKHAGKKQDLLLTWLCTETCSKIIFLNPNSHVSFFIFWHWIPAMFTDIHVCTNVFTVANIGMVREFLEIFFHALNAARFWNKMESLKADNIMTGWYKLLCNPFWNNTSTDQSQYLLLRVKNKIKKIISSNLKTSVNAK